MIKETKSNEKGRYVIDVIDTKEGFVHGTLTAHFTLEELHVQLKALQDNKFRYEIKECAHKDVRESWHGCVADWDCNTCGEWLGDKDYS